MGHVDTEPGSCASISISCSAPSEVALSAELQPPGVQPSGVGEEEGIWSRSFLEASSTRTTHHIVKHSHARTVYVRVNLNRILTRGIPTRPPTESAGASIYRSHCTLTYDRLISP
jgi:hypothetical protein